MSPKGAVFEEVHEWNAGLTWYLVPNEDTVAWHDMLAGKRFDRAAGICSSGEVGLFAILPYVRHELVLIDHSLASLSIAMSKYLILRKLGGKKTHDLFTKGTGEQIRNAFTEVNPSLPPKVSKAFPKYQTYDADGYKDDIFAKQWAKFDEAWLRKVVFRLNRVRFVHGDLADMQKLGTFDLAYISNADRHAGRSGPTPIHKVTKCLNQGGLLLLARAGDTTHFPSCTLLESRPALPWQQNVYRFEGSPTIGKENDAS